MMVMRDLEQRLKLQLKFLLKMANGNEMVMERSVECNHGIGIRPLPKMTHRAFNELESKITQTNLDENTTKFNKCTSLVYLTDARDLISPGNVPVLSCDMSNKTETV